MKAVVAHKITSLREVTTKFGNRFIAELEVKGHPKKEFWMSEKQWIKLSKCAETINELSGFSTKRAELHIIIDDGEKERFVWCGIHSPRFSELKWLEDKFGVKFDSPYVGRYDLECLNPPDAHESLKDE